MATRKSKEYYIAKAREMCAAEGKGKNIRMSGQLVPHLDFLRVQEVENFIVVTLDGAHRLKNIHTITSGILNKTIVHPREVFRPAIVDRAAALGADLQGCLPQVAGRTGVGRARWVAGHADPQAESPLESLGRFAAIEAGLPAPVSNAWVGDGRPRYRVDGLWPHHWAVFEADGAVKYDNRPDASSIVSRQREREWELRRLGLRLCRYDWHLAWGNPSELAQRFRHLLADHPPRGTPVRWWRHDPVRGPVDPGPADWPDPLGNYVTMPPLWWKDRR